MTYEIFQQGASVYVPVILISLIITMVVYCAFPLIFAKARKSEITKKKYKLLCYGINILLCLTFAFINGGATSFLPYLIWTWVIHYVTYNKKEKTPGATTTYQVCWLKTLACIRRRFFN